MISGSGAACGGGGRQLGGTESGRTTVSSFAGGELALGDRTTSPSVEAGGELGTAQPARVTPWTLGAGRSDGAALGCARGGSDTGFKRPVGSVVRGRVPRSESRRSAFGSCLLDAGRRDRSTMLYVVSKRSEGGPDTYGREPARRGACSGDPIRRVSGGSSPRRGASAPPSLLLSAEGPIGGGEIVRRGGPGGAEGRAVSGGAGVGGAAGFGGSLGAFGGGRSVPLNAAGGWLEIRGGGSLEGRGGGLLDARLAEAPEGRGGGLLDARRGGLLDGRGGPSGGSLRGLSGVGGSGDPIPGVARVSANAVVDADLCPPLTSTVGRGRSAAVTGSLPV